METEEELNKQLEDIVTEIDKAKRELKALRRRQAEGAKGRPRASFITGREWKTEADEAAKQLDALKQREHEIRTKLHSGDH
jgi:ribosomal protein L29